MSTTDKRLCDMKTTRWSITYWLTEGRTIDTLNALTQAMPNDWALEGQIEQGKKGVQDKLHAQLFLKTPQTRGTRIQKFFPNCDIDEARNVFALKNYVHKEDTRVAEFKTIENRSPQWSVVCDKFFDYLVAQKPHCISLTEDDYKLREWDIFIGLSIREGMRVDIIGVNPQYRSCIIRYWDAYWYCADQRTMSIAPSVDNRQTDRQELEIPVAPPPCFDKVEKVSVCVNFLKNFGCYVTMEYYSNADGSFASGSIATLLYKMDKIISLLEKYNHASKEGKQACPPQGTEGQEGRQEGRTESSRPSSHS